MYCTACKEITNPGYMCDMQDDEGVYCSTCFEVLHCEDIHGGGCVTLVIEDDDDEQKS